MSTPSVFRCPSLSLTVSLPQGTFPANRVTGIDALSPEARSSILVQAEASGIDLLEVGYVAPGAGAEPNGDFDNPNGL